MLYITFSIASEAKFKDFQKLYEYMCTVRQPGYEAPEYELDFETATEQEIQDSIDGYPGKRPVYQQYIPDYADEFIKSYLAFDNSLTALPDLDILSILNYLEYGFEVDLDRLETTEPGKGIVEFSTGNYPYGGMERFLIVLKGFGFMPEECFNGFQVYAFNWISDFHHEAISLPEKTETYLKQFQ